MSCPRTTTARRTASPPGNAGAGTRVAPGTPCAAGEEDLNDVHSRLNPTRVTVFRPASVDEACRVVADCAAAGLALVPMGARHAMGGQQFLARGRALDTSGLSRVLAFDADRGLLTVEAGIRWPAVLAHLADAPGNRLGWTIRQKQTGADDFSLGGALASNIHGRGLAFGPFVDDVEAITLIDPQGHLVEADRHDNAQLFSLVAGGYGMFGVVARMVLRLVPRQTLRREVRRLRVAALAATFDAAAASGCTYGDFQFAIDPASDDFLSEGILSCYRPVSGAITAPHTVAAPPARHLQPSDFARLLHLAHIEPTRAFEEYAAFYLGTDGQHYASDAQQSGVYLDGYHAAVDCTLGHRGSEMITELYVPRDRLAAFMARAAATLRMHGAQPIYGTVRLIEADTTSVLAWAREAWACVVLNLHVRHGTPGIAGAAAAFRGLIDDALAFGGSYYLTYHRWATRAQLAAAHPRFGEFLAGKRAFDPEGRWDSDWYRHYAALWDSVP